MNINEDINAKEVRLVKEDGEQMGVVDIETAMKAARDENLDLVELVPEAKPPVCKIMDYKHFLYDQKQKAKEAKKNQKQTQLKEMKLRPSTEEADYQVKLKKSSASWKTKIKLKSVSVSVVAKWRIKRLDANNLIVSLKIPLISQTSNSILRWKAVKWVCCLGLLRKNNPPVDYSE